MLMMMLMMMIIRVELSIDKILLQVFGRYVCPGGYILPILSVYLFTVYLCVHR